MRNLVAALAISLVLPFAIGCSSSDDDDGGGDNPDAAVADQPDAADSNPPVTGFGAVCEFAQNGNDCTAPAMGCGTSAGAALGVCTLECATTPEADMAPPAGSDQVCATAYTGMVPGQGTPGCVLRTLPMAGQVQWLCAIVCGDIQGTDFGGCPGGLTCQMNTCNP